MKKLACITIFGCALLIVLPNQLHGTQKKMEKLSIINDIKAINEPVLELLTLTNITHDGTLSSIVKGTQKSQPEGGWLRKPGTERWHMEEREDFKEKEQSCLALFDKLSMLHDITPTQRQYDYCLWFGGTAERVRTRFADLLKWWDLNGVRINNLIIMSGDRDLDPKEESEQVLFHPQHNPLPSKKDWNAPANKPTSEFDMMRMVLDQTELSDEFKKNTTIALVNAPKVKLANGTLRRPNTSETITCWLEQYNPKPGSILALSNQPFVGYQDACLRTYMPSSFTIETVGSAAQDAKLNVLFDTLARWLYQEQERLKLIQQADIKS